MLGRAGTIAALKRKKNLTKTKSIEKYKGMHFLSDSYNFYKYLFFYS